MTRIFTKKRKMVFRSGRDLFCAHVDGCFWIAGLICILILGKIGLLQLAWPFTERTRKLRQHFLEEKWDIPVRGTIYDTNGVVMATSLPCTTLVMDPFSVRYLPEDRRQQVLGRLARLLDMPAGKLEKLSQKPRSLVRVKTYLSPETAEIVETLLQKGLLPGMDMIKEQHRIYPWQYSAKAVLGVVRGSRDQYLYAISQEIDREKSFKEKYPWYHLADINGATPQRGIGGIEQGLDAMLAGKEARNLQHLDKHHNIMPLFTRSISPKVQPYDVKLTLDAHLQKFVANEISRQVVQKQALIGMAVVMAADTGEVLAAYSASWSEGRLHANTHHAWTASFEPGSVAKPLMMLYAFHIGALSEGDRFDCNQPVTVGDKTYRDEHTYDHLLSPSEILMVSSDSGMAWIVKKVIERQGTELAADLTRFYRKAGLGQVIVTEHSAVCRSTLPSPASWSGVTPSQLAIGYELEVSPFHLAALYAGFASSGRIPSPHFVRTVLDPDGNEVRKSDAGKKTVATLPSVWADCIREYLKSVVQASGGTGYRASVPGYPVFGKTGTSRRLVNKQYSRHSHNATFMGVLPISRDRDLVIGVFFQDIKIGSDYGGTACAPIFKTIAEHMIHKKAVVP